MLIKKQNNNPDGSVKDQIDIEYNEGLLSPGDQRIIQLLEKIEVNTRK